MNYETDLKYIEGKKVYDLIIRNHISDKSIGKDTGYLAHYLLEQQQLLNDLKKDLENYKKFFGTLSSS